MDTNTYLNPGQSRRMDFVVEEQHSAKHIGSGSVGVLATPWMIAYMEICARTMLDELLPEGYSSVGTKVNVRHLAPSVLGSEVSASSEILSVDGNRIEMEVVVWQGDEMIGQGQHERFVIEVERFLKRLK